ncbi:hypothetical protein ACE414_09260 [Alteromonas macleodii]|uniref:hypothetical protein n=1 Tax=Alteromonas macleodii TaxID=28108 RepID=UPI003649B872
MEFHTDILGKEKLLTEVAEIISFFTSIGINSCQVMLGFGWGINYYQSNQWSKEEVKLDLLLAFIEKIENATLGEIGKDDLFIWVSNTEFKLCNDGDIHLLCSNVTEEQEHFLKRWQQKEWNAVKFSS